MEMKKKMGVGGNDYTGESTWPKGLANPAAKLSGPMTKAPLKKPSLMERAKRQLRAMKKSK